MVSRWVDLDGMLPHLLASRNEQAFLVWLDKCMTVDARATLRWLKDNEDALSDTQLSLARLRYGKVGL